MSIWNKVLVGLIGVASLALFYLAARTMKTHQYWRELAAKYEQRIDQLDRANEALVEGSGRGARQPGIRQLRLELSNLVLDRGRQWLHCERQGQGESQGWYGGSHRHDSTSPIPTASPTARCSTVSKRPTSQKQGRYLGEFRVAKSDEKQKEAVMAPTARLSPAGDRASGHHQGALGPLRDRCPGIITRFLPRSATSEKKAMLPAASLPEYLKDGKPAGGNEPPDRVADGKYVRPIRDYQVFFTADRVQRTLLVDAIDAATRDEKLLQDALAQAKQQEEAVKVGSGCGEGRGGEVPRPARRRGHVSSRSSRRSWPPYGRRSLELVETNKAMAGRIAKMQLEAVRRIDERTRAMAQSGAGGL